MDLLSLPPCLGSNQVFQIGFVVGSARTGLQRMAFLYQIRSAISRWQILPMGTLKIYPVPLKNAVETVLLISILQNGVQMSVR